MDDRNSKHDICLITGESKRTFKSELEAEIVSSDEIMFLVSFIRKSGVESILSPLHDFTERGGRLKVLTTTYMGVTDPEAIQTLSNLKNTEIKVSYDTGHTRLHAKAYIFLRGNRGSTAFIGSSNLSEAAIVYGMEWNVKLNDKETRVLLDKAVEVFDYYWNSNMFIPLGIDKFYTAVSAERERGMLRKEQLSGDPPIESPFSEKYEWRRHQDEILKALARARANHFTKNLVVSATGTGKTVVAAVDYRRLYESAGGTEYPTLLFVAHTIDILRQSLQTFRNVLKNDQFGSILAGNIQPKDVNHLFMSIQSYATNKDKLPSAYDIIIIDEVHHSCASSYRKLIDRYTPRIMLGLTATPYRMDKLNLLDHFDGRIAAEYKLSEAINDGVLVPFHYLGVSDGTDLTRVKVQGGSYNRKDLDRFYQRVGSSRFETILKSVRKYIENPEKVKCLGFCTSIEDAEGLAEFFKKNGLKATAITSQTNPDSPYDRYNIRSHLQAGNVNFVFTVDLYNEGVDIPEIDTVLFLRPTESKRIFVQQLGRGLRTSDGKDSLLVLDFVGQSNKKYRGFREKFAIMSSSTVQSAAFIRYQLENSFEGLPKGCTIELEEKARESILETIEKNEDFYYILDQLGEVGRKLTFYEFLKELRLTPVDVYRSGKTYTELCASKTIESPIKKALPKMAKIDSRSWIHSLLKTIEDKQEPDEIDEIYLTMLAATIGEEYPSVSSFLDAIRSDPMKDELIDLLRFRYGVISVEEEDVDLGFVHGLKAYASYTADQISAAIGMSKIDSFTGLWSGPGVYNHKQRKIHLFSITIRKDDSKSETTKYLDGPVSETCFQWQSQSVTSENTETGRSYVKQAENGYQVLLFVRGSKEDEVLKIREPYVFIGKGTYVSHKGGKPMTILWDMDRKIPEEVMQWNEAWTGSRFIKPL